MILIRSFLLSKSRRPRLRHPLVPLLWEDFGEIPISPSARPHCCCLFTTLPRRRRDFFWVLARSLLIFPLIFVKNYYNQQISNLSICVKILWAGAHGGRAPGGWNIRGGAPGGRPRNPPGSPADEDTMQ